MSSPVRRGADGKGSTDRRTSPLARNLASCLPYIVWGAEQVQELKIVHRLKAPDRFYRDAIPMLNRFVENRSHADSVKNAVGRAMNLRIGSTLEEVLSRFKDQPFTRSELASAWKTGLSEGDDPTTVWGLVQGMTAVARESPYTDQRVSLERRAGALLR